jgi:phenol 2-monooxygenase
MIEIVVIHPPLPNSFVWKDIPTTVKKHSEMRFYGAETDTVYNTYGVSQNRGAIAVVRPDGYVGLVAGLSGTSLAEEYLSRCLCRI